MIYNIDWNDTIKKHFRSSNNEDLGEMHDITNDQGLIQRRIIYIEKFPLPKTKQKVMKVSFS